MYKRTGVDVSQNVNIASSVSSNDAVVVSTSLPTDARQQHIDVDKTPTVEEAPALPVQPVLAVSKEAEAGGSLAQRLASAVGDTTEIVPDREVVEYEEEEEAKPIDECPNHRFLKFDEQLGQGSFKTVYRGLDKETGVEVAWCELQVGECVRQCTLLHA
jgi:WNK lysine deficient protein kinase